MPSSISSAIMFQLGSPMFVISEYSCTKPVSSILPRFRGTYVYYQGSRELKQMSKKTLNRRLVPTNDAGCACAPRPKWRKAPHTNHLPGMGKVGCRFFQVMVSMEQIFSRALLGGAQDPEPPLRANCGQRLQMNVSGFRS